MSSHRLDQSALGLAKVPDVPDGYDRRFDILISRGRWGVGTRSSTWGEVRRLYR